MLKNVILLICCYCFIIQITLAQTTVTYTFTAAQSACGEVVSWDTPTNALVQDDTGAIANALKSSNSPSACLIVSAPVAVGTDVACAATVQGIEVTIRRQQIPSTGLNGNQDALIQFVEAGTATPIGNDQSTGVDWTNEWLDYSYGGSTDTWGLTFTATDITDPDFGLAIKAKSGAVLGTSSTASVDYVEMTVTYAVCPCAPTPEPGVVTLQKL